jgi:helicase MOV-10
MEKPEKIDKQMKLISNLRNLRECKCKKRSCREIPPTDKEELSFEEFHPSRVVIATLISCGRIVSADIKATHFDYIFIDEAASESEQSTLIPILGLGASQNQITAQIVLSGDHKQLRAIIQSPFCQRLDMEKSMMERIMETNPKYQKSGAYDERFVTLLVKNYRSHESILRFSNENFYDSQLVPCCPKPIANFAVGSDVLKNQNFPIIFHATRSPSKGVGKSQMNEGEIEIVLDYLYDLLTNGVNGKAVDETDVGIISPYRAQRDRIVDHPDFDYQNVEVGTVDSFQGREKKIVILSTVQSQTRNIGFLSNKKRLNVALTRAQSLLIIVGNPETLQKSQIWSDFISYCKENRALIT